MTCPIQVISEKADKSALNAELFCPIPNQNFPNFIRKAEKEQKKSRSKEDYDSAFNSSAQRSLPHCA